MLAIAAAFLVGAGFGFRFRVGFVGLVSFAILLAAVVVASSTDWHVSPALVVAVLIALQAGYFLAQVGQALSAAQAVPETDGIDVAEGDRRPSATPSRRRAPHATR